MISENTSDPTPYGYGIARDGDMGIAVKIQTENRIELADLSNVYTSISNQYHRFCEENKLPYNKNRMRVNTIRPECINLILFIGAVAVYLPFVADTFTIVDRFVQFIQRRSMPYTERNKWPQGMRRTDVSDIARSATAIAKDPNGSQSIASIIFEQDKGLLRVRTKLEHKINTSQALTIVQETGKHLAEMKNLPEDIANTTVTEKKNVEMIFNQISRNDTKVNVPSEEYVFVDSISLNSVRLIYGTVKAKTMIRRQIHDSDDNALHKIFHVDLHVIWHKQKPWAYKVMLVHKISNVIAEGPLPLLRLMSPPT